MYNYFKDIASKSHCNSIGACSINPSVIALHKILLNEVREISFYIVKLKEFGFTNKNLMAKCIEILSIFFINTNYDKKKYLSLVENIYNSKKEIKEKYLEYCKENNLPYELISSDFEFQKDISIAQLIEHSEKTTTTGYQNIDSTKANLFELIALISRLSAISVSKIKKFDKEFCEYDYEILRFFALTNAFSIRTEKIKRRILDFSLAALKIKKILYSLYENRYGKKSSAIISKDCPKGHNILVSGDDLIELEKVLKTIEEKYPNEEINVYTHGALFLAHFYPYFKNNKFLKGHFGTDDAEYDFSTFSGAILITQNFIKKIDNLYRGEIFSSKIISFEKIFNIKDDDYTPLINAALNLEGFKDAIYSCPMKISYDLEEINKIEETFENKEIVIILEKNEDVKILEIHNDKYILKIDCPLENEILLDLIDKLKEKNVKITLFFPWCNLEGLDILLLLLNKEINLSMAVCKNALINPHVIEALRDEFKVEFIE